ncbi:MAG: DUF1840 domain-containing protein [Methylophaga sp.]|nr:DUF1840 domain-containing protein [Methylophaga sp.]
MLVTFSSKAHADITMFGEVAQQMLKIMGHSGAVPSALHAQDLPAALANLQKAVADSKAAEQQTDADAEFKPGLSQRALPLINLLKAAIAQNADVMWD